MHVFWELGLCKLVFALSLRSGTNSVKLISSHHEVLAVILFVSPFEMAFKLDSCFTVWVLLAPSPYRLKLHWKYNAGPT